MVIDIYAFNYCEFGEKRSSMFLYIFFCGEIYRLYRIT